MASPRKPKKVPKVLTNEKWVKFAPEVLALAKYFEDAIKLAKGPAREFILKRLDTDFPVVTQKGGFKVDADATGNSGTISYRGPSRKTGTGLTVGNPKDFMDWCEANGIDHGAQPSVVFPAEFVSQENLAKLVEQAGGVLPDGLVDTTAYTQETLVVRMDEEQKEHLLKKKGGMTIQDFADLLACNNDPEKKK